MISLLHEHGDNMNIQSESGVIPIMVASMQGQIPCISLLKSYGGNIKARDNSFGWDALHWAIYNNHYQTVIYLVDELNAEIGNKDFERRDAIDLAKHLDHRLIFLYLTNFVSNKASWRL